MSVMDKMDWDLLEKQIYDLLCEFPPGHPCYALKEFLQELLDEHNLKEAENKENPCLSP